MPEIFSHDALQKATHDSLDSAFKSIPDGRRGALIVLVDQDGARASVAAKIGDHWQLAAGTAKPWNGPIVGSIAVAGSW